MGRRAVFVVDCEALANFVDTYTNNGVRGGVVIRLTGKNRGSYLPFAEQIVPPVQAVQDQIAQQFRRLAAVAECFAAQNFL